VSRVRCVFFGTPEIAAYCLRSLLEDEHFAVVGVVSQPDRPAGRSMQLKPAPVKQLALEHELPVLQPETLRSETANQALKAFNAECAVVVAFGQLLPVTTLQIFPQRVVNVHASLLPRWRGAAPIQRAIMAGDTETGVALQVMTAKLDAGDVLGMRRLRIGETMTALELHDALMPLAADLLRIELMDYMRGNLVPVPQDESLVTIAPKLDKAEAQIDWHQPAVRLDRLVRGMSLGPGTWTTRAGQRLKILRAVAAAPAATAAHGLPPGRLWQSNQQWWVACGDGALQLLEVQPESKPRLRVEEYFKGRPAVEGEQLG
jgi:methionyl-tRNA formyltransferase